MYNDEIRSLVITDLEDKELNLANTILVLSSQGYVVNEVKRAKLALTVMLIEAFKNIEIFSDEQIHNIENLYNKLSNV